MQFDTVLEVETKIYVIEHFSKKLISIDKISKEVNMLKSLQWEYTPAKNGMLVFRDSLLIYSIYCNYFFLYNIKSKEMQKIEFENLRCDGTARYYSNLLIYKENIILLPFEGNNINVYDCRGRLKNSFILWNSESSKNEKNIRENSAVMINDNIFFSLRYKNENYLCNYNLKKKENKIVYRSNEAAVRGICFWNNKVIFRRIFSRKTEVVFWDIKKNKGDSVIINMTSPLDANIYISNNQLYTFVFNKMITIFPEFYEVHYELKKYQSYIGNGVIFDYRNNEILLLKRGNIQVYKLNNILKDIKKEKNYMSACNKLFSSYIVNEGLYDISNLFEYLSIINCD